MRAGVFFFGHRGKVHAFFIFGLGFLFVFAAAGLSLSAQESALSSGEQENPQAFEEQAAGDEQGKVKTSPGAEAKGPAVPGDSRTAPGIKLENRVELGFNGSQGNAETFDYRAAAVSVTTAARWKLRLDGSYFYGSRRDTITRNEYSAAGLGDLLFPGTPWSYFIQVRYDWDAFKEWQSRVSANTGAAYKAAEIDEKFSLVFRAGLGYFREYGSEDPEIRPEGLLGLEVDWRPKQGHRLEADLTYYPEFTGTGDYRALAVAEWRAKLEGLDGISLSLGLKDEYNSDVDPGFEYNDFKYYGSLAIDF